MIGSYKRLLVFQYIMEKEEGRYGVVLICILAGSIAHESRLDTCIT